MLKAFLRAAEKYDRTIVFRTWSVGVGRIGDMHTNPETYLKVLGHLKSDHLVVSTKYCAGDFYSWLPLNPTLSCGDQRRIMEFQAKREFEGFGSFPNYTGPLHQAAIQSILRDNPHLEGAWVWTQYGGPLRAGPLIIYPFYGFNVINELNVYALSRLLQDPYTRLDSVTSSWVRDYFGSDSTLVARVTDCMNNSYNVMLQGLYIGEFAKYDVKALGLEPPPMLWIFEWDILGASSSVFSNIYFITRDHFREVIDEGLEALRGAVGLKEDLLAVRDRVSFHEKEYDRLIASVDYEIELFRLLDYYRQFFMHYYRWLDTGDLQSRTAFQLALGQFTAVADFHLEKYGGNLNTLGINLGEAGQGTRIAGRTFSAIRWARVYLVLAIFLLIMGIPGFMRPRGYRKFAASLFFDSIFRTQSIDIQDSYHSTGRLAFLLVLIYLLSFFILSSFAAFWFPVILWVLSMVYCIILGIFISGGRNLARILVTLIAPRLIIMALFMSVVAVRGPGYLWYQFWVSDLFKIGFLSLLMMMIFRKYQIYTVLSRKWGHRNTAGSFALVFMALGIQLLIGGALLLFFGLEKSLTTLNDELLVLPGGLSRIMGITTHLGIPVELPEWILYTASVIIVGSFVLFLFNRRVRHVPGKFL
jgi:MFS family permease